MGSSDLCEDLLVEILSRLPVESLLRFRSLSKWSYACIASPDFIRLHARRSPNKLMLVHDITVDPRGHHSYVYSLHLEDQLPFNRSVYDQTVFVYPFEYSKIIGSCNGIICIYERRKGSITLWNPSVRRMLTIHGPPHPCYNYDEQCFDYDSNLEDVYVVYDLGSIGFGYDPITDDHKILTIDKPTSSFVYSMKSETWRKVDSPCGFHVADSSYQCCFNGALYCVVTSDLQQLQRCYIMRFDLSSEVFTMIELPQLPDSGWETRVVLTIFNGRLAMVSGKDEVCRIWVRIEEECNNDVNSTATAAASWSPAFTVKLKECYFHWTSRVFQLSGDALLMGGGLVIDLETQVESWLERLHDIGYVDEVIMFTETLGLIGMGRSCSSTRYPFWGGRYDE